MIDRIAIFGANSILGQSIKKALPKEVELCEVYNNRTDRILLNANKVHIADFFDQGNDFSHIFFVASYIDYKEDPDTLEKVWETNIRLLKKVSLSFGKAKIIYASSVSIFDDGQDLILTENSPVNPRSSYSLSKLWGEHIVRYHPGGGINIRISSLFGENMNFGTFLPLIVKSAIQKKEITLFGEGKRKQNYISSDEAANYFVAAMHVTTDQPLLAVNSKSYSNLEVAKMVKKDLGDVTILFQGGDNSKSYVYNNLITKKLLGYNDEYDFASELTKMLIWMKKQF